MQATSSSFRASPPRRPGLILAAIVLAVSALASVAALLDPPRGPGSAGPEGAIGATVPVGIIGDSAVSGDPSVPSAASVFKDRNSLPEEPVVGF